MLSFSKISASLYWRTIRRLLPSHPAKWAGVKVNIQRKLLDTLLVPSRYNYPKDKPNYENSLVLGLKESVREGDTITIIGGGFGVTAVIASNLTGRQGKVLVFEGSDKQIEICKNVFSLNETLAPISLVHQIVGVGIGVYGTEHSQTAALQPDELVECDVLQMDCEGSELGILKALKIKPRIILVETHGVLGASSKDVEVALRDLTYKVSDLGLAEIDHSKYCLENDIRVLLAERRVQP